MGSRIIWFRSPGWIIGFLLPVANTIAGWGAIEFFGGKVTAHKTLKDSMSISIQPDDLGNWGPLHRVM
jgi:hypothetical protein